jgi:hypothetical protein
VSLLGVLAAQLANGLNLQTSGPDPDPILDLFYGCGSSINWDGYCNKEVDQLIDSGRSTGWRGHVAIARLVWPEAEQGLAPAGLDTIRAKLPKKGTLSPPQKRAHFPSEEDSDRALPDSCTGLDRFLRVSRELRTAARCHARTSAFAGWSCRRH